MADLLTANGCQRRQAGMAVLLAANGCQRRQAGECLSYSLLRVWSAF